MAESEICQAGATEPVRQVCRAIALIRGPCPYVPAADRFFMFDFDQTLTAPEPK